MLERTFQNTGVEGQTFINKHRYIHVYSLLLCCFLCTQVRWLELGVLAGLSPSKGPSQADPMGRSITSQWPQSFCRKGLVKLPHRKMKDRKHANTDKN